MEVLTTAWRQVCLIITFTVNADWWSNVYFFLQHSILQLKFSSSIFLNFLKDKASASIQPHPEASYNETKCLVNKLFLIQNKIQWNHRNGHSRIRGISISWTFFFFWFPTINLYVYIFTSELVANFAFLSCSLLEGVTLL